MKYGARCLALAGVLAAFAASAELTPGERRLYETYRELIEIRTVHPDGDNTAAARAMAKRLLDAGFDPKDVEVVVPMPLKGNVVARLRGTGELKPLLLLAHIDVVEAKKEDWSEGLDPFKLTEKDGYYYARGSIDDKSMASIFLANLIRLHAEGFRGKRDIIVALTADEEGGTSNGVSWLLANRRDLVDAGLALNEGGGGTWREGRPFVNGIQIAEKVYQSFEFLATNPGGHSSIPERENAIYDLSAALERLNAFRFPARLSAVTRGYFAHMAEGETGAVGEAVAAIAAGKATDAQIDRASTVARFNAQLRTTCVATRLEGGHADNALPQRARAIVNCRIFPGDDPQAIGRELQRIAGERVSVKPTEPAIPSPPADPASPAMRVIARVSESMWPGVPAVPLMSTGATDGLRLRNAGIPTYGTSGIFTERGENRLHGRDERVAVRSFYDGAEYLYRLAKALASE
jgi:acetylornithine deacetylase/succinyl-diaminopimelate desuccinylase-like protein